MRDIFSGGWGYLWLGWRTSLAGNDPDNHKRVTRRVSFQYFDWLLSVYCCCYYYYSRGGRVRLEWFEGETENRKQGRKDYAK